MVTDNRGTKVEMVMTSQKPKTPEELKEEELKREAEKARLSRVTKPVDGVKLESHVNNWISRFGGDYKIKLPTVKDGESFDFGEGFKILLPESRSSRKSIKVGLISDSLVVPYDNRDLQPGFYAILGKPGSGKSTICRALVKRFISEGVKCAGLKALEPSEPGDKESNFFSLLSVKEIADGFNRLVASDSDVIFIDSLRFFATITKYPAKTGGIPGGLDILVTVLDEALARAGKIGFGVISTNSADNKVMDIYQPILEGSCQGLITPTEVNLDKVGSRIGYGEITIRGHDRSLYPFEIPIDEAISLSVNSNILMEYSARKEKAHTGMTDQEARDNSLSNHPLNSAPITITGMVI